MSDLDIHLDPDEACNFTTGQPVVWQSLDRGSTWRRLTGWRLLAYHLRQRAYRLTRWWRPRTVCSAIDRERGIVTMAHERWSWRRWRWERR
jgi:hypothetical protein